MNSFSNIYLSIGSNQGDKLANLQQAVNQIALQIGTVTNISPVYKTEAFGFKADDFFNICIELRTNLTPHILLYKLLSIETKMGRIRAKDVACNVSTGKYESRIIDIDILFYHDEVIVSKDLMIPHPEISKRAFVLKPLADIAADYMHPVEKKYIHSLLQECQDTGSIEKTNLKINKPQSLSEKYNYLAIEGNIGAGKTTLTSMLTEQYNAKQVLERFADNPFLPKFYKDEERYAFPLEMSFLADRYQQLSDDLAQFDLFKSFIVSDYYIFKSLIFAQVTLAEDEYSLYRKMFDIMYKEITKPDLYIYLYQNTDRLLENIKKRGRDYEQNITADYLNKIHKGYANFIQSEKDLKTLIIDVSNLDFVSNPDDYQNIVAEILKKSLT
ncbi:MAG: 2-amino-4-hydroxy-6-hydroxymethyldihydropteridine diphosphokinase [Bacteroidota bacterium]